MTGLIPKPTTGYECGLDTTFERKPLGFVCTNL